MNHLLLIDTSTTTCSVAIATDEMLLHQVIQPNEKNHAAVLPSFVEQCLLQSNLTLQQINTIAISIGPGSYTGLRVGLSFAKGLCDALQIPLIAVSTLEMMAYGMIEICKNENHIYVPIIDARRMEVYTAAYNNTLGIIEEPKAMIVKENSWQDFLQGNQKIILGGSAAEKSKTVLKNEKIIFVENELCMSSNMIKIAVKKYADKDFADLAYCEPFYLKEFNQITL